METITMIAQVLLGLSILIILHEGGHFLAARAFGIKVEKFYLFFDAWGIKLFKFRVGETEYGMGWLPLGGYVKIAGMIDESMDKEAMKLPPQPWEFRSKPAWQRLIVMIGGVTVNLLLGIFIFWMMVWANGKDRLPISEMKYGIHAGAIGKSIGLEDGDVILAINDKPVTYFDELKTPDVVLGDGHSYTVKRGDNQVTVQLPPNLANQIAGADKEEFFTQRFKFKVEEVEAGSNASLAGLKAEDLITAINDSAITFFDQFQARLKALAGKTATFMLNRNSQPVTIRCAVTEDGKIGFMPGQAEPPVYHHRSFGFFAAAAEGCSDAFSALYTNIKAFGKIFTGKVSASKSVQGPIGIAKIYGTTWDWLRFWTLTGMLSLVLAFMNLLPIPALDGGHVVFLLIEIVRGKPASDKVLERAQLIGMIILLTLMVLIFGNDIYNAITR